MAFRKLEVLLVGDPTSLNRALGQASSKLGRFAKTAGLALGAAGLGGALATLKVGFEEASESAKVLAQTDAVLKSTGAAANVTAKHVGDLATALSKMSGVDDEAIQSGQNLLLTFTKVRNEAGKGNDVFDQATRATLDLSVAMRKDMSSSAILVGKALNDPVKGMGALSRAGVQFTAEQKKTIKALVESGHAMDAQKMILSELTTQFGGSAKAAGDTVPGQLAKARVAFEEVAGKIVTKLLPALTWMLDKFSVALDWVDKHWPQISEIVGGVVDRIKDALKTMGDVAKSVFGFFDGHAGRTTALMMAVAGLTAAIGAYVVISRTVAAVTKAWAVAQGILNVVMSANPIVAVTVAIVAIGAALVVAYERSETFRKIVNGAFEAVVTVARKVAGFFTDTLPNAFRAAIDWVREHWPIIATLLSGPFAPIVALATNAFGIRDALVGALTRLKSSVWNVAQDIGGGFVKGIEIGLATLESVFERVIKGPLNAIIGAWNSIGFHTPGFSVLGKTVVPEIHFQVPQIPKLAAGGIVTRPTLAMIGEAGPEAVVPLRGMTGPAFGASGGGGVVVNLTVNGWVGSDQDIAERVRQELVRYGRRNPSIFTGTGVTA